MGGVARRAWARNQNSIETGMAYNQMHQGSDHITLPFIADDEMIENLVVKNFKNKQK
jgi:urocanate hydratase